MNVYDEKALLKEEKRKRDEVMSFLYKNLFENNPDAFYIDIFRTKGMTLEIEALFIDGTHTDVMIPSNMQDYNFETLILEILENKFNYDMSLVQTTQYPFKEILSFEKLFSLDLDAIEKLDKEDLDIIKLNVYFKKNIDLLKVSKISIYSPLDPSEEREFRIEAKYIKDFLKTENGRYVYLHGVRDIKYPNLCRHVLHNDIFDATPEEELYFELR